MWSQQKWCLVLQGFLLNEVQLLMFIYLLELSDENRDFYLPGGGITKKFYEAW